MTSRQAMRFAGFVWKMSRSRVLFIVILTVVFVLLLRKQATGWWGLFEPAVTILTLGVAVLVWYQQAREEWEEDYLPKRLTASFYFEGQEVMRCENAHLADEADIRALTQQIGWQMSEVKEHLKFAAPDVQASGPEVSPDGRFVHYTASVQLLERPSTLPEGKRRVWKEPFVVNGTAFFCDENTN